MVSSRIPDFHVLTDTMLQTRHSHAELAFLAAAGGATAIQFREKRDRPEPEMHHLVHTVQTTLGGEARLIVNDHVDIAATIGADGVHLGPNDMSVAEARRRLGPDTLIGRTANDLDAARKAADSDADYLGVGPVFGTQSKVNPPPRLGLDRLAEIVAAVQKPVIAIGSITIERVSAVLETGVHGVAVLGGVACSIDPEGEARAYRQAIDRFRGEAS